MFYRFNALFNVSKTRALVVSILCFIAGFALLPLGPDLFPIYGGMFVWSLIYGSIWYYKFSRDRKLITRSYAAVNQQPATLEPPMTSPGSSSLFVPQPLDR